MSRRRAYAVGITTVTALLVAVIVFPFYVMLVMSTHVNETLYRGLVVAPGDHFLANVRTVLAGNFLRYYANSTVVSGIATTASVFVSSMAGYGLAMYRFKFRNALLYFVLATMMIPPHLGIVAYVVQMRVMGLSGTLAPLVFWWVAHGFGVFWMTQFMRRAIPGSIVESARIDGYNEYAIFLKLGLPLSRSALVTLAMIVFVLSWNNYLLPLILINRLELYTVPLGVATLGSAYRTDYTAMVTGLGFGTLPVLLIFVFGSRHFIRGITAGAIKG